MRNIALIGTIVMLILPFAYVSASFGDISSVNQSLGFFYLSTESDSAFDFLDSSSSGTIESNWFEDDGVYHYYFDPLFGLGILVFILLLINIGLSVVATDRKYESLPGAILIICGVLLTIIRWNVLGEHGLSFYHNEDFGTVEYTYIELPLALIWGLVFGILDLRK